MSGPIVPIAEGDLSVLDPFQRTVGNGDAKEIVAQVVEDLLAAPPGVLTVYDPGRRPKTGWHLVEQTGVVEGRTDLRPEDLRQRLDRDEGAAVLRGDPRGAIGRKASGGDEQMNGGMIEQRAGGTARQPSRAPTYCASRASVSTAIAALFISSP